MKPTSPELTGEDLARFGRGAHVGLYDKLGAHPGEVDGREGSWFGVWAPGARGVSVVGSFNGWDPRRAPLKPVGRSGLWQAFVPGALRGHIYKFHVRSKFHGHSADKADPFAFFCQPPPETASVIWGLDYDWKDESWMASRAGRQRLDAPMSIYEVHLGSWMRPMEPGREFFSYREMAERLTEYVLDTGYTHVELMPVMEHPYYGSWGYQTTGYFAPTSRYGTPQDFMAFVDHLHSHGIGVLLDWVPSHFPGDGHALGFFDGTHLYEHADPRKGFHPDWTSLIFNYGLAGVRNFLLSSALFWLDRYHVDGLRVDAVASMLYLDYSRDEGEWEPNRYGGRENLDALEFLKQLNDRIHQRFPGVQVIAEESTAWPQVSGDLKHGGLGFDFKWDMGWMHDTLEYIGLDPLFRSGHHDKLSFRMLYAFSERFLMPLSHDEVVYGKGSLIGKMPGDVWQKFAHLRLLLSYLYAQPGKKLLFMGGDIAQWKEWDHESALDWHLLGEERHKGIHRTVQRLNRLYRDEPALHERDAHPAGFRWLEVDDQARSVFAFLRYGKRQQAPVLAAFNFTPVPQERYRLGVPSPGKWLEIFNSDAEEYGGSGMGNLGQVESEPGELHGHTDVIQVVVPPLGAVFFKAAE